MRVAGLRRTRRGRWALGAPQFLDRCQERLGCRSVLSTVARRGSGSGPNPLRAGRLAVITFRALMPGLGSDCRPRGRLVVVLCENATVVIDCVTRRDDDRPPHSAKGNRRGQQAVTATWFLGHVRLSRLCPWRAAVAHKGWRFPADLGQPAWRDRSVQHTRQTRWSQGCQYRRLDQRFRCRETDRCLRCV